MLRQTLTLLCLYFLAFSLFAQNNRTIDGTMNNLQYPDWGSAHGDIQHITTQSFGDGISSPAGADRPNPRIISNAIFAQDSLIIDFMRLSDYTWVFGQFIDHDVIESPNNPTEPVNIPVNFVDPWMNPSGFFLSFIPMSRSMAASGSGTDASNPRDYFNAITAWIDASSVYGSEQDRAEWLRTFSGGKLKTSSGNLLPFNTVTGEMNDDIDPDAPAMANENPFNDRLFVAGDVRANENLYLIAFHTIFVREHNRLCDVLAAEHPGWGDEQLYQRARKMVGAIIQSIVYNEWLPAMGIFMDPYQGYDPDKNPNISNVFATAAFRMGHTLLNSMVRRRDNDGAVIPEGDLRLKDAFFQPTRVATEGGIDPLFKGMGVQIQQDLDAKVVDDVRNFLFGPPGSGGGGLDLAAININRGRERGLADFNTIRQDLGLAPYTSCSQICGDSTVAALLESIYGDVDNVDAWVGMLAEDHMSNALVGETIMAVLKHQFGHLRDGDRFFYLNDPGLTVEEREEIDQTRMRDILMRNTGITVMQSNVFLAMEHDSICPAYNLEETISGNIFMENGAPVEGVTVEVEGNELSAPLSSTTGADGYQFAALPSCESYTVTPLKNDDHRNGVTTFDIVLTSKHILDVRPFTSPYQLLAADVNQSGTVTTFDVVLMRKLILAIDDEFEGNTSWQFVDASYSFTDPSDPFNENYPDYAVVSSLTEAMQVDFVAIKNGDVNNTADPANLNTPEDRSVYETLVFEAPDQEFKAGEWVSLEFNAAEIAAVAGYQFTLEYDQEVLEFGNIEAGALANLGKENFAVFEKQGKITSSWNGHSESGNKDLFSIRFRAKQAGRLSELIDLSSSLTLAEAYALDLEKMNVRLEFGELKQVEVAESGLVLMQNRPNPFRAGTTIGFILPDQSPVQLRIYDLSGRLVYQTEDNYQQGYHEIEIDRVELGTAGVYYYQLSTQQQTLSRRMVLLGNNQP